MELETFPVSIEPMPDSCTVFAPPSPVIHAKLHFVVRRTDGGGRP